MDKNDVRQEKVLETVLRDNLAGLRTILANERTFLAYVRTALSFLAAGAFFVKFVDTPGMAIAGWLMLPAGMITGLFGLRRYLKTQHDLHQMNRAQANRLE